MKSQLEVMERLIKIKNHKAYISELEVPEEEAVKIANCKCILYNNDNKTLSLDTENFDFIFFTKIRKEKQYLIFETEMGKEYIYDFNALKFITKPLSSTVEYFYEDSEQNTLGNQYMQLFKQLCGEEKANILEWPFSCLDLIENYAFVKYIDFSCEKGYIKYLRKTNQKINEKTHTSFLFFKAYQNINNYHFMQSYLYEIFSSICDEEIHWLMKNENFINKLRLSSALSFKKGFFSNYSSDMPQIIDICWMLNNYTMIDSNATIKANFDNVKTIFNIEQAKLYKQSIDFWTTSLDLIPLDQHFCIKIPNTVEDLIDEGKQQHNCVGGLTYTQAVIKRKQLIFFIRSIDNPSKSFITCCYDFRSNMVKNYLRKYNNAVPKEYLYLVDKAESLIREVLKKREE